MSKKADMDRLILPQFLLFLITVEKVPTGGCEKISDYPISCSTVWLMIEGELQKLALSLHCIGFLCCEMKRVLNLQVLLPGNQECISGVQREHCNGKDDVRPSLHCMVLDRMRERARQFLRSMKGYRSGQ